jgi:RNA 3'-terminal phosphate cyclase-like protein
MSTKTIKFEDGAVQFRQRLIVSILSHRPLLIRNIRSDDLESPGLREHEASFLRLLDRMTNGSTIEINATGTQLRFKPGVLLGGDIIHECPVPSDNESGFDGNPTTGMENSLVHRASVGWFLEGILPLAPFGKNSLNLTLEGITDGMCDTDLSPDYIATSILPIFQRFGIGADADDGPPPSIQVTRRGAAPLGGGRVTFACPIVKEIPAPIDLTEFGKIKRVRGTVVSCRIPPSSAARVAHSAKGLLHRLLPDVWIHTDTHSSSGKRNHNGVGGCGKSPGLAVCLAAESTEGTVIAVETCLDSSKDSRGALLPEDLGVRAAAMLLDEVRKGGCIDTGVQSIAFLLMCLGPEDVSRIRIGNLSQYSIVSLRLLKEAFGVEFKVKADNESKTVLLSCLGTGYRNMARAST